MTNTNQSGLHDELEALLAEGIEGAVARENVAFDEQAGPNGRKLVLFGAGGLGRRTLAGLRKLGIEPLAFADNNSELWNQPLAGVPVMSPEEAGRRYGKSAVFIVTTWSGEAPEPMRELIQSLHDLGCERVVMFGPLYWKYPDIFLPHYATNLPSGVHRQAEAVREAAGLWDDDASRREYLSQIRWRLNFDFDGLAKPVQHPTYFPSDLCSLIADEVFVDCGAYDGDTIASFLAQPQPGFKQIIAFEPDPRSFARLQQRVAGLACKDSILLHQAATGAENCTVRFSGDGTTSAAVGSGPISVKCVKLDDVLQDVAPTYLKMDIEGAEPDALLGARNTIAKYKPVLTICSYHQQDHVWTIPRLIRSFSSEYRFFLRPHLLNVWDLVTYAIPVSRLLPARSAAVDH